MLEHPKSIYESIHQLSSILEDHWKEFRLPETLKNNFAKVWKDSIGYSASPTTNNTRLYTSSKNSENITDCDLAQSILTAPLWLNLHALRIAAIELANTNKIHSFHEEYKTKATHEPKCWNLLEQAIQTHPTWTEEEKQLMKNFLTDSEDFYDIKGIIREDFSTPAICKSINKRVDRFSIADQIAHATTSSIYQQVKILIENLDNPLQSSTDAFTLTDLPEICAQHTLAQSLITKPFVILTGASGTGKTKLAESLAECLRNSKDPSEATNIAVVPVGSDWTDNRNVLGFVNHLRDSGGEEKLPIYQSTDVLDLLLAASNDPHVPYFLILDEMNLSHVERYFSDFLSVMEQKRGKLRLHNEAATLPLHAGKAPVVPSELPYPPNLFVIGTVNIDETTYMFSPKVLDRANVIEFKVGNKEMEAFLASPHPYPAVAKAPDGVAEAFLQQAQKARANELAPITGTAHDEIQKHLLALFSLMQKGRFEFAYRTANEVTRYLRVCRDLATDKPAWEAGGWKSDLDDQILQKILPKLHGSIGRIGPLLAQLAYYSHHGKPCPADKTPHLRDTISDIPADLQFPKSSEKLQSMIQSLLDEQFVSFIQ